MRLKIENFAPTYYTLRSFVHIWGCHFAIVARFVGYLRHLLYFNTVDKYKMHSFCQYAFGSACESSMFDSSQDFFNSLQYWRKEGSDFNIS